jgi:hypothetical protein
MPKKTGGRRKAKKPKTYTAKANTPIPPADMPKCADAPRHQRNRASLKAEFANLRVVAKNVAMRMGIPTPDFPVSGNGAALIRALSAERVLDALKGLNGCDEALLDALVGERFTQPMFGQKNQ